MIKFLIILLLSFEHIAAQFIGVFLSAEDLRNNRSSYSKHPAKKYRFHLFESKPNKPIKICIDDTTIFLSKDKIFAAIENDGKLYRLFNGKLYKILNPNDSIVIYSCVTTIFQKGVSRQIKYCFSISLDAPIYLLTLQNLKEKLYLDSKFVNRIDLFFHHDDDLIEYDFFHKMYKLNYILQINQL